MLFRLSLMFAFTALISAPAAAFDIEAMNYQERDALRAEIRAYLLDNPEVLIEAINVLESRKAAEQAAGDSELIGVNAEALLNDGHSWVGGNPDGDITIVEFMDYRCAYCKRAFPEVSELITSDGNIRFIVKEFPILGDLSVLAARFAIAVKQVAGDEAYAQVHDSLMTMRGAVSRESLFALGAKLNLDAEVISGAMQSEAVSQVIADNRELAQRLQISGTPSFVFGDKMLRGYLPIDGMRDVVAGLRAK